MTRVTIHIPKIKNCITSINSLITYHKNDFKILMVVTVCQIPKSDHRIERYYKIKFSWSACISFLGGVDHP